MVEQWDRWAAGHGLDLFEARDVFTTWLAEPVRQAVPSTRDEVLRDALGLRRAS